MLSSDSGGPKRVCVHGAQVFSSENIDYDVGNPNYNKL